MTKEEFDEKQTDLNMESLNARSESEIKGILYAPNIWQRLKYSILNICSKSKRLLEHKVNSKCFALAAAKVQTEDLDVTNIVKSVREYQWMKQMLLSK